MKYMYIFVYKKKLLKSGLIQRKDTDCSENEFQVPEFFFARLLVFEIWPILMYETSCMQMNEETFAKYDVDANQSG